jgi:hypothetical protein
MKTEFALLLYYGQPTMTLEQVAELMRLKPKTVENRHYARECPIPLFKIGNQLQAHISDVAAYIDEQRAGAIELLQQARQPA